MNEIKSIQLQIERQVIQLSSRIEHIYSALEELSRLTLLVFRLSPTCQDTISRWMTAENFVVCDDGHFRSKNALELHKAGELPDDVVTYHWPATLANDPAVQYRFHALREIGESLRKILTKLNGVTTVYFQDVQNNTMLGLPYTDMQEIPSDFNWQEYHACISVNPVNNPQRSIQWSPPNIDYAGHGLISIVSIPLYEQDEFIGVWSIDVPFNTIHQECIFDSFISEQTNFITDFEGNIVIHPTIHTEINKDKGAFFQKKLSTISGEFADLDFADLANQTQGEFEVTKASGEVSIVLFHVIPKINWILFATLPKDVVFESVRDKIIFAFEAMKNKTTPDEIAISTDNEMQILINSYNDMIKVLTYNQIEKQKAQQKALDAEKALTSKLEQLVQERTQKLRDLNVELQLLADTDSLTGLHNRRYFFKEIPAKITDHADGIALHRQNCVLIMDIDRFKRINDVFGHDVGDEVLRAFSRILKNNTHHNDVIARFGGEEFIAFLPATDLDTAQSIANAIKHSTEACDAVSNVTFTVSVGVATCGSDINQAIKNADKALYAAKNSGRNRVELSSVDQV